MSFISNLFAKAAPVRSEGDTPKSPYSYIAGSKRSSVTFKEVVTAEAALKHPITFRCIGKIIESVASIPWYCEADPDAKGDVASPAVIAKINSVLQSPNDGQSPYVLRQWLALNFTVYGRVPFKVGVGIENIPNAIYPLTTRHVQLKLDDRGRPIEYGYSDQPAIPTKAKARPGQAWAYEITRPNLDGTCASQGNLTALNALAEPLQLTSILMQRALDIASGEEVISRVITAPETLTDPQFDALASQLTDVFGVGGERAGGALLTRSKLEVQEFKRDLSDLHSKMPLDDMARQIAGAFGIPIALLGLGAADGAKFASNYADSRRAFWEETIIPGYAEPIASGLTAGICPYGARIMFDYDKIPTLSDVRMDRLKKLSEQQILTVDEARELVGYPKLGGTEGGRLMTPGAVAPLARASA